MPQAVGFAARPCTGWRCPSRIDFSMTDPSLFKQVARHIVQRGQLPDGPTPAIGQSVRPSSIRPPGRERQMGDERGGADGVPHASDRNWAA